MRVKYCPECDGVLLKDGSCQCGWGKGADPLLDQRCHYQSGLERCPLPGTMVEGLKNTNWLCRAHWNARHDPHLSHAILIDIQNNLSQWTCVKKDWREVMIEARLKKYPVYIKKKSLDELLKELKARLNINEEE